MIRALLRLVLVAIILVAVGTFLLGWWGAERVAGTPDSTPVGTSGPVDPAKARDVGAKLGERTADAANKAQEALSTSGITAKIKSKMALDDLVNASDINVDTNGSVVTLRGVVPSEAARQRAVALARETEGVRSVEDKLVVKR